MTRLMVHRMQNYACLIYFEARLGLMLINPHSQPPPFSQCPKIVDKSYPLFYMTNTLVYIQQYFLNVIH